MIDTASKTVKLHELALGRQEPLNGPAFDIWSFRVKVKLFYPIGAMSSWKGLISRFTAREQASPGRPNPSLE